MKLRGITVCVSLCIAMACVAAQVTRAQEEQELEGRLRRVSLFKNGLGFFTAEAPLPEGTEGVVRLRPFLAPSHGTFWVSYPRDVALESLVAREAYSEEMVGAAAVPELLRANVGRRVRLYLSAGADAWLEGTLLSMAEGPTMPRPSPYAAHHTSINPISGHVIGRLAVLETKDGKTAFNPGSVARIDFPDSEMADSFGRRLKTVELVARLTRPAPGRNIQASYLAKGITWVPSYTVDISREGKAHLTAKALVVNEAADLEGVHVDLVTGFPHLEFSDVLSPIARKQTLSEFFGSLRSDEGSVRRRQVVVRQREAVYRPGAELPDYGAAAAGTTAEDLFLYPLEGVWLTKDETGYFPLFSQSMPHEHIYQWEIPDYLDERERYRAGEPESEEQIVWHSLRLENTTDVPWTTAAAQTVRDGQILGQDILSYTPRGGKQTLRITRAVSVAADEAEYEVERDVDARRIYGYHYDLVTIRGTLKVTNFKDKRITLEIVKTLSGEIQSTDPEPEVQKLARGLKGVNKLNRLTWTIEMKPGESRNVEYTYKVLVRR